MTQILNQMLKFLTCLLTLISFTHLQGIDYQRSDVQINLINPTWEQNIFTTIEGGVVSDSSIRIQAKKIKYLQFDESGNPISKIEASGNLMVEREGKIFIGDSFEYDFSNKTGVLKKGQTALDIWFFKSSDILFLENGDILIENATLTSCESEFDYWKLVASSVLVEDGKYLTAKNVRFQVGVVPFFWVPFFHTDLDTAKNPSIKFNLRFGGKDNNRLGVRYRIWDNENWSTYFRLAYHISRGFGGGLEFKYNDTETKRTFFSQNFFAKDSSFTSSHKKNRYQFAGRYTENMREGKTELTAVYDKTSDDAISRDYYTNDYTIQSVGNTYVKISNRESFSIQMLKFQYRVNNFQTVKQELPSLQVNFRPISIDPVRAYFQSQLQAEYLDFAYAKGTPGIREFSAPRLRLTSLLYRPININPITVSPYAGVSVAFYGNSPELNSVTNHYYRYGIGLKTHLQKAYSVWRHAVYPFVDYSVITKPSKPLNSHYIFDYEDAFSQINMLTFGINQSFYLNQFLYYPQMFKWSVYAHAFLNKTATKRRIPRIYTDFSLHPSQSLTFFFNASYYRMSKNLDLVNSGVAITANDDFAFRAEFQHRTKYSWLKANPSSFILDVTRSEDELLNSTLSKPQNSLITTSHLRLHPSCSFLVETRNAWKRNKFKPYTEWKSAIELLLKCQWKLELSVEHTTNDNRFGVYFSLLDGKKKMDETPPIW